MMKKNIDSLSIFNTALTSIVFLCISSIVYAIFKYHISGFGTYADFIIALANVIMAAAACYGILGAKDWLKKREEEELFNKKQKINSHIIRFTAFSTNLMEVVSDANERNDELNAEDINRARNNIADMIADNRKKFETEWNELTFELESIRFMSKKAPNENLYNYFNSVRKVANELMSGYTRFLLLFMYPWDERELADKKNTLSNIAIKVSSAHDIIKDAYDKYETSVT